MRFRTQSVLFLRVEKEIWVRVETSVFVQAEDGMRSSVASRGLGDVYGRQVDGDVEGDTKSAFNIPIDAVRAIKDQIKVRVEELVRETG